MRGKVAHGDNRVIGYGRIWSSFRCTIATAFSFPQIQRYLTSLSSFICLTGYIVYRRLTRKFKRVVRKLCREQMEPYFDRWRKAL
jgi:hypothetical protein